MISFSKMNAACSRDGSVRLWDCGESKCLAVVSKSDCPVNSCALTTFPGRDNSSEANEPHSKYSFDLDYCYLVPSYSIVTTCTCLTLPGVYPAFLQLTLGRRGFQFI